LDLIKEKILSGSKNEIRSEYLQIILLSNKNPSTRENMD
jgi:hypothetical protein